MGVMTWSPLAYGFLTGKHRKDRGTDLTSGRPALRAAWFDPDEPQNAAKFEAVEKLAELADELGCTLPELAVAFVVAHPAVTSVILGPRTLDQLKASIAGAELVLDDATLDRIDEIVPPGTDVYQPNSLFSPPALRQPLLRRRPLLERGASD
jgi:aryl-alcohol dehydrogenase-like predicted oxidoreductase